MLTFCGFGGFYSSPFICFTKGGYSVCVKHLHVSSAEINAVLGGVDLVDRVESSLVVEESSDCSPNEDTSLSGLLGALDIKVDPRDIVEGSSV